jgi:hypothetical protein
MAGVVAILLVALWDNDLSIDHMLTFIEQRFSLWIAIFGYLFLVWVKFIEFKVR